MAGHVAELIHRFRSYVSTLLEIRRLQLLDRPNESEVVLFFSIWDFHHQGRISSSLLGSFNFFFFFGCVHP